MNTATTSASPIATAAASPSRSVRRCAQVLLLLALLIAAGADAAHAFVPSRFVFSRQLGWKVDATTGANVCTAISKDTCQKGEESKEPGGFSTPTGVAVAPNGNVYVADRSNNRVQELTQNGEFILMFGWKVNQTTGGNICTATSKDVCGAGGEGTGLPEQQNADSAIAIDPKTGNIFLYEQNYSRIEEFSANGEFILMLGGDVNETTGGDVCTAKEVKEAGVVCKQGVASAEPGAFIDMASSRGNVLTVGGPKDQLYVGDRGRVQRFEPGTGKWAGAISLAAVSSTGAVNGVAVDAAGNIFVSIEVVEGIHLFNANGELQATVIHPGGFVNSLALDAYGRLGVVGGRGVNDANVTGFIYGTDGVLVSEFEVIYAAGNGLAFAADEAKPSDRMYIATGFGGDVQVFAPVVFPEVTTCAAEAVTATSATLCGSVNPEGLLSSGMFEYGTSSALGSETPVVFTGSGETFEPLTYQLTGLLPNQTYDFQALVEAEVEEKEARQAGEPLRSFHTQTLLPATPGAPVAGFVTAQSALFSAMLNPEHAPTHYRFEYAACEEEGLSIGECAAPQSTEEGAAAQYGTAEVALEARGLQPRTYYAFRLVAEDEHEEGGKIEGGQTVGVEGHFHTGALPQPSAQTGGFTDLTPSSATIGGTVDPDGRSATYAFQLGVYEGEETRYGTVFSGSAGDSATAVEESLALSGLQPGTTYAYRIGVSSGYIDNPSHTLYGAAATFTTPGLPAVLSTESTLPMLAVPAIAFPSPPAQAPAGVSPRKLTAAQRLAKALKACAKKPKNRRAACRGNARKQYRATVARARTPHRV